jgi:predicted phosphodiesterase
MNKRQLARDYRAKYGWEMPTSKLARIIYEENKLLFNKVENVRTTLREIEHKGGKKNMSSMDIKRDNRPINPYKLPESEEVKYEPFEIKGHDLIGILSDIHLPYHDLDALTEAVTRLKEVRIKANNFALLLNGDSMDCHTLSRFMKDPKKRDFKFELDTLNSFLDKMNEILDCKIYFKIGNHEQRYEHFLNMKAHELKGIEEFEFSNIIKATQRGIDIIQSNQYMTIGNLRGIHGHEYFSAFSPVNIARGLYTKSKVSAFQGHNHQTSEHTETDMNGKITTTWSVGCLSSLHPSYMPLNKWNHGFAYVEVDGEDFNFYNKRIYKGKTL